MKRMSLFSLLLTLLLLVGCASSTAAPTPSDSEEGATESIAETTAEESDAAGAAADLLADIDPSGQTIIYWHQHSNERAELVDEFVKEFNESNEYNITVRAENAGDYGTIYNKMIAGITTGEVPDLVGAYQNQAASYQLANGLIDLTPYMESEKWGLSEEEREDFFGAFIQADYNPLYDQQLGFPPNRSMEVLYYNIDMLNELGYDAPPATWEEFREMACAAKEAGYMGYKMGVNASSLASIVFSRGGEIMNEEQNAYSLDNPVVIETMEYLQALYNDKCMDLVSEPFGDQADFGAGQVLFTFGSTAGIPYYEKAVGEGYKGNWAIAAFPHSTPDPVMNVYGPSISVARTTPERQLASWIFLKWLTEPAQQARWTRLTSYFPVRRSVASELEDFFAENPHFSTAFELLEYGKSEPPVGGYDVVRSMVADAMHEILNGADAAETLSNLNEDANEALEEFRP